MSAFLIIFRLRSSGFHNETKAKQELSLKPEPIFYCSFLLLFQANFCRLALLVAAVSAHFEVLDDHLRTQKVLRGRL